MATRAVRERKRDWIILGLLAAGIDIDAGEHDARDNFLLLPLFFDACSRSGISAAEVCGEAAKFLEPDAAKWVMRLTRHPQTLESMGYRISADTDGFRYVRDW